VTGCTYTPNSQPCNDGNPCTTGDTCTGGKCVGPLRVVCDDENACTDDTCDPASGCTITNHVGACDDKNACTKGDVCVEGFCNYTGILDCDDRNPCTTDLCDPSSGCVHLPNQDSCSDGNACTMGDMCWLEKCVPGMGVICVDDGNICTKEQCDPAVGCTSVPVAGSCDDGDKCTLDDTCVRGSCLGTPKACSSGNTCMVGACLNSVPGDGCYYLPAADNTACEDGIACTTGETCLAGTCKTGAPQDTLCGDALNCTDDHCSITKGCYWTTKGGCGCSKDSECDLKNPAIKSCCKFVIGDWFRQCHSGSDCN
jgi:hypothetical protein